MIAALGARVAKADEEFVRHRGKKKWGVGKIAVCHSAFTRAKPRRLACYTPPAFNMRVTLLVPDLFWPHDDGGGAYRGLELPALARFLSRARRSRFPPLGLEAWLCQAFGVERQQDWPVAPFTLDFDGGDSGDDYWLRADPVHLAPRRDQLRLVNPDALEPGAEDAAELIAALNLHFAGDGLVFRAPHPSRWYLHVPGSPRLMTREVSEAAGQDIGGALPSGEDGPRWRHTLNEIQMLLHEHPVNQRRESRGKLPINSVWLWGGGRRRAVPGQPFSHVGGTNALALALAASSGARTTVPGGVPDRAANTLIVAEASAARFGDDEAWRQALAEIERAWFTPLLSALTRRNLDGLVVVALHPRACERFEATPMDLLKFWRPVRPFSTFAPGVH